MQIPCSKADFLSSLEQFLHQANLLLSDETTGPFA